MFKSLLSYFSRIRTVLFGRKDGRKEALKRMAFERKRNGLRQFIRKGLRVEGLEPRALMAVDLNVIGSPFAVEMDAAGDEATISRLPAASPYPASLMVQTNTPDPDQDDADPNDNYHTFIRTSGTGASGITVSDVGSNAGQTLTVGGNLAISNPKGTDRAIASFTVSGIETINLDQSINVSGSIAGDADTVNVNAPAQVAQAVSLVKAVGDVNVAAGSYGDGSVTVAKESLTVDIADGASGFSLALGAGIGGITLTGAGDMNVTGNSSDNTIVGNDGANVIDAGAGNDTLTGGLGNDTLTGGAGVDTAIYSGNYADFTVAISGSTVTVTKNSTGEVDTLTGVEKLDFSDLDVLIVGSDLAYTTITAAINAAASGDVVLISAGTYNEALEIEKEIHLIGSGNGTDQTVDTIIDPTSNNSRGSQDGIWFGLDSDGSSIASLRITGATNGIQIQEASASNAVGSLTFKSVALSGNTTYGLNFRNSVLGTTGMVTIEDSEFSDNGQVGIRFPSTGAYAGISVTGSTFENNGVQGFATLGGSVASVSISDSTFANNGTGAVAGHGDLILNTFSGNATLSGLTITGDGTGGNGLQVTGTTNPNSGTEPGTRKAVNPIGTVSLSDITISGSYGRDVALIGRYTDLVGLTISGLSIDATQGAAQGWAQFAMDNVGGDIDLADYGLESDDLLVRMSTNNGVDFASATDYTSGAALTGGSGSDGLLGYTLGDTLSGLGGADYLAGNAGDDTLIGGAGDDTIDGGTGTDTADFSGNYADYTITFSGANVIVTGTDGTDTVTNVEKLTFDDKTVWVVGSAVGSSLTTINSAVTASANGDVILVATGTYTENVTVSKAISIQGPFASVAGTDVSRSAVDGTGEATVVGMFKVSSSGSVTISGLRFLNNASSGITGPSNPALQRQAASAGGDHTYSNNIFYSTESAGDNTTGDRAISFEVLGSGSTTVSGNYITGNGTTSDKYGTARWNRGIWSDGGGSSSITISNNTIEYARSAMTIDVAGDATYTITDNTARISGTGISFGLNAAGGAGNITGMVVDNVDTDFNFQNLSQAVTFSLADALSGTVSDNEVVVVLGGTAGDTLTGSSTVDYFTPNAGGDTVNLAGGNDFVTISSGSHVTGDSLDGGDGSDTIYFTSNTASDTLVLPAGTTNFESALISSGTGATTGTTALNLDASAVTGALSIEGNDGANTLSGGSGNDTIDGNAGNDVIQGNAGDDTIDGGAGTDSAVFSGNYSAYTIAFSGSNVTVNGPDGNDTVTNVDKLTFADRSVYIVNAAGSTLTTIGSAVTAASDGDVILVATGTYTENVTVNKAISILGPFAGVAGTDVSRSAVDGTGEATVVGMFKVSSSGSVTISGLRFLNNASSGITGPSNPALQRQAASAGGDHTYSNNIFYSTESAGDNTTGDRAISFEVLGSGSTTVSGNYITGNGTTSDKYGTARWNRGIWSDGGGSSSITISNNTIEYARSAMTIDVAGDATYTITDNTARISGTGISFGLNAAAGAGNITGMVVDNVDTDFNFQNLSQAVTFSLGDALSGTVSDNEVVVVLGGTAGDTLTGSSTVDYFTPNAGADTVDLAGGDDYLTVSSGSHVTGDSLDGGDGSDTIYFTSNTASDTLVLPAGTTNFESALISSGTGATTGTTALNLDASAVTGALSIEGNDGANTLSGGSGDDTIDGNAGNDVIQGNAGDDTIDGGAGTDSAVFSGNYSAYTIAFSGSNVTVSGPDGSDVVTNVDKLTFADRSVYIVNGAGSTITTIDAAITAANAGDVVLVAAGTYTENLTISKALTIKGVGSGSDATANTVLAPASGTALTVSASNVTIDNLRVAGASNASSSNVGVYSNSVISNLTLSNLVVTNHYYGITIHNNAVISGLTLTNVDVTASNVGLRTATSGSANNITISDSAFNDNDYGWNLAATSGSTTNQNDFNNVTVSNTTFNNNKFKGLYAEKLNNATFTDITVDGSGYGATSPSGINVNLKYGTYTNISFDGLTVTGSGQGTSSSAAVAIAARNDAASYNTNPASLTGLSFSDTSITGSGLATNYLLSLANAISGVSMTGVSLAGTGIGLLSYGSAQGNPASFDVGNMTFAETLSGYIANGGASTTITATGATFAGVNAGDGLSNSDAFTISDKVFDSVDVSTYGKVILKSGSVYVTPNSFVSGFTSAPSLQRGVDTAAASDSVIVASGTYTGNVNVSKALSILGPFASVAGTDVSRSAVDGTGEATVVGMFKVSSSGSVTISGLRFLNNASSGITGPSNPALQRQAASAGGDHTYSNNIFYSTESAGDNTTGDRAISFEVLGSGSTTVSGNYITGNGTTSDKYGTARWNRGIWSDGGGSSSITISNNTIEYARSAMTIDVAGDATYTITDNTARISGTGISFGLNAAAGAGNITGMVVDNVDTDFNFQNLSQAVTFSLGDALSGTVSENEVVVVLGGTAGDTLTGSSTVDYFTPNAGADTVDLAGGDDYLTVSSGSHVTGDSLDGGDGSDTIYFTSNTASDTLVLPAGTTNFESALISSGTGATTGTTALNLDASAVTGALSIEGNDGANTLSGGSGDDTIDGNAGNDVIQGNAGDDTIDGGTGSNTAVFSGDYSDYAITLGATVEVDGPDGTDSLTNIQFLQFDDITIPVEVVSTTATISAAAITYGSSATITVTIARESGTPLPGGTVSLVVGTADPIEAQLDANGVATFTVPGLTAGSYDLAAAYAAQGIFGASSDTETLTVNTKTLTVSGATATNRAYDGTLIVSVAGGTLVGIVGSDDVSLTSGGTGTGTMADKHVGTGKAVTVTGYTLTGAAASNYSIDQPTDVTVDISTKTLTVSDAVATDRVYNATTTVVVSGGSLEGIVDGDEVSLVSGGSGTGTMEDKNVGTDKSVTVTGYAIEGTGASNYSLTQPTGVTVDISAKTITVSGADATNRVYDATTTVSVSGGSLVGVETDDVVNLSASGTGTMTDKNVGTGKSVTVTGYSISGDDSGNYLLTQPTGVDVNITAKTLTVSGADATDRVYNASTTVDVSGGTLVGVETDDVVNLSASGTGEMTDKNVGTGKSVTVSGYSISGTDAANYSLDQPTGVDVDITVKTITVTGADATNRVYDATTTVSVSGGSLVGVETGDAVDLSASGTGEMSDKNVGTGKSVTVTGYSISGTDAANYSLDQPTGVDVDITAKTITVSGADATDRVYDATTTVSVSGGSLVGVETDDIVNLSASGTGTMTDKNVGTGKSVTVTGYSISGDDSGNYLLTQPTGVDVDITAKTLTVSGADATDRVYNATTTVAVSGGTLVGIESGDSVDLDNIGTGEMTDKNVGTGKSVTVSGYSISGTDAANYSLDQPTGVNVDITTKTITVSGTEATDRIYDATTAVSVSGGSLEGVESGDIVNLSDTDGTGAMADKNVGTGKSVTVSGYSISGTDSGNYSLTQPTGVTVDISTKSLTGTFTVDNKQYDGTTSATVATRTANQISGDDVSLDGGTATFDNKNVGTGKIVSLTGAILSGADAANYTIGSVTDATADVTAISLTGAFTVDATKVYDGNTSTNVLTRTIPTGVLGGETVTLVGGTAAYSDKNVADGKTVSLSGASLSGADAGNYVLGSVTYTTANITKKDVTGSLTVDPRQYDGTNVAIVASTSVPDMVSGDTVQLDFVGTGDAATFNNAFVGNGKLVTPKSPVAGNWSLSGTDAGNYNLTSINTTTANITKRTLNVTVTVNDRVYNGTTVATVNNITSDKLELDDVTVTSTSAAFNDKTAAEDKSVTISGLSLSGGSASQYELASTTATSTATVTKAPLTLNFLVTATKVYDGTDTANITASNLTPPVFGDDAVGITGVVAKYDSKNVGANKPVTIADGYSLTGADAGNYEVTAFSPRTASITAKSLSVTSWAVDNKVYDGTDAATISSGTVFAGLVSGDTVTLGGTATFADKNAGDGKVVTLASPSFGGTDGGNYSLSGSVGTVTADITKKTLTPVYSASSKFFDGNNVATVTLQSDDRISGDVLTISYASATFADSAIGANKDVTISTISVSGTDSGNYELNATSQTLTASINNNPPVVTTSSGNTPYFLGNVTVIDAAIVVDDFESTYAVSQDPNSPLSLGGGSMTVSVTENQGADDYLLISPQGSDAGQIGIDEGTSEVTYGGVVIGTYAGGYEEPLVITFGSSATLESVQALARRIAFSNNNMETTIEARTVSFVVNDGVDSSDAATKSVTISASNQPPVLTPSAGSTNFTEGSGNTIAAPVRVDNSMTVSDTDQLNFDTGVLTVSLGATGTADDRLSIISSNSIGAINVSGSSVRIVTGVSPSLTAVEIGTFTGGTSGSDPLVVTLNAEATVARTQLLVRAVGFQNVSNAPSTDARSVEFQLSDGAGATSTPVTKTVTVTATNDLPVVVLSGSTPTFTEPTGPTTDVEALPVAELIDNGVSISDPDNPASFDGGNVTATIVSGGIATSDRFGIRQIGGITVSGADAGVESVNAVATATVSHDGVVFGTISLPSNAVRITFNSEATLERVQALARALTVRNTSDLPGGNRSLRVQVTDNASGTSAFVTKTVTVVSTNDIPRITGAANTSLNLPRTATSATNALGGSVASFVDSFANGVPSDMNGGTLTASMKRDGNSSANVQVSIFAPGTGITLSGNDIIHTSGGVATTFGTITSANPVSGGDLTITFNANANATRITALLKQLRVRAVSGATTGSHVLTVTLTEPDTDTVSITRPFNVT